MTQSVEARQLAAFLTMFKHRIDRSYEALALRTGVSSSSLHRYCAGSSVPSDFGTLQRFARECGATQPELRELLRLWVLADAGRRLTPMSARTDRPIVRRDVEPARPPRTPARSALLAVAGLAVVLTAWWIRKAGPAVVT